MNKTCSRNWKALIVSLHQYLDECAVARTRNQMACCLSPHFTDLGSQTDFELTGY